MPDPTSRQSELIDTLIEYLTSETVKPEFEPDMTWDNYSLDIASNDPPLGAVYVTSWMLTCQQNQDSTPTDYDIVIRLLIAKSTFTETLRSANAWGGFLTHTVLKKLRKEGYKNLFAGIDIKPKPTIQDPLLNQDGGAKTSLIIPCSWHDAGGTISGFNY